MFVATTELAAWGLEAAHPKGRDVSYRLRHAETTASRYYKLSS